MLSLLLVAVLLATVSTRTTADTFLVLPDGAGDFPTIQAAINASADGDRILLGNGVFTGDGNRDVSYGGKEITVRSESDSPADCILDCQGSSSEPHRGFIFNSDETALSRLRGVTITGGYADGPYPEDNEGGAVYLEGDSYYHRISATIENCLFRENSAVSGGGVYCRDHVYATFSDCVFEANETRVRGAGGGMYCYGYGASPYLVRCRFIANLNEGMYFHANASPTIEACEFSGHSRYGLGAASDPGEITNCRFFDNDGHGLRADICTIAISGCSFWNNHADNGGALRFTWEFSGTITDCLFYNNTADESGGAVWCGEEGSVTLTNCTIAYNEAGTGAGGIDCGSAAVTLENTIIAFSTAGEAVAGNATLSCCDLFGNAGGDWIGDIAGQYGIDGNISEDPIFRGPWDDDFTLQADSPCAPFSSPNPECDLIGSEPIGCQPPTGVWPPAEGGSWGRVKALFLEGTD
ncbi:MAG: right-handed parallel beta-helix repeat-containing protein [Candidatus Eisenbacteria sp.]|nr:right-handed parallel beta-helix repeat-containing protein [Candidatus Eisenbacteria bacterium]